jgi:hypothetical protein
MLAIALVTLSSATELYGLRFPDRVATLAALDKRALTGMPRLLDHDEGQELQEAVTGALAANPTDGEMAWAALRASFAIVPQLSPPISDSMPSVSIQMLPPFTLPWKVTADVAIEASLDGSDWRHASDFRHGSGQFPIPVKKLFSGAVRPGFHEVRLRASLRFDGAPGFLPTIDTRELPILTYGITGTSVAGQRIAALLTSAARANASDFDSALPQMPLGVWLRTVAATPGGVPVDWVAMWCGERTNVNPEQTSICARAYLGSSPDSGVAIVWVKVATVDTSGATPTWTAVTPTLEGIDLMAGERSTGHLAMLPSALRSRSDDWPAAAIDLDPAAMTLSPAAPKPGEPVTIEIEVRNGGTSDLLGSRILVDAGDAPDGPAFVRRQFVRSIPAGESVVVKIETRFPRGYGAVSVLVMPLSEMAIEKLSGRRVAWRVVRPDLAPPDFVDRMAAAIGCKPDCHIGR